MELLYSSLVNLCACGHVILLVQYLALVIVLRGIV